VTARTVVVQTDMRASVAQAAASRNAQGQDLRSPDARDAASVVVKAQDLRSPDARDAASVVVKSQDMRSPDSRDAAERTRSAWPSSAWSASTPEPASAALPADDGSEWSTLVLGIGGALLLAGGLAFAATRTSRRHAGV